MESTLEYFAWARPLQGYAWEDAAVMNEGPFTPEPLDNDIKENRFLMWRDRASQVVAAPLLSDNPTLFRDFASLEPTEEAFLAFANAYGWLGVSQLLKGELVNEDGKTIRRISFSDPRAHGEPLWRWKKAHRELSKVSDVLQSITTNDLAKLNEWFTIGADAARYERRTALGLEGEWICANKPPLRPALWKWANQGKTEADRLKRFAFAWAQKRINDAIGDGKYGTSTSVRVLVDGDRDLMSLHIVPDTLLAAMWLQCARVLTENPTFKACENCGKWFELAPNARRKNSMYCSARCKLAAHRARIPATCHSCGVRFNVSVTAGSGFAYMNHYDVSCPKCGVSSSLLLPGEVRGVALRGKRQPAKATA
jgi:hypothetical protein